jgi:glucose-1-phosphate adenylyltransferase
MDYSDMVKFHNEKQAEVTLAVNHIPQAEIQRFGTVIVNEEEQVTGFQEKAKKPKSNLASMGVYLFRKDILQKLLEEDAPNLSSKHDFGRNIIPKMMGKNRIFAYSFDGYWRDVGTVQAYWEANMELLEMSESLLFDVNWTIRTIEEERPPAIISETADTVNSLISNGCVIEGHVEHSVLSPGVRVAEGAVVKDSVIMSDSVVGRDSVIDRSILDKEVIVEAGCHIGFGDDLRANRKDSKLLNTGITIICKRAKIDAGVKIGRNCVICGSISEEDFPEREIQSGETIVPKRRRARRKE